MAVKKLSAKKENIHANNSKSSVPNTKNSVPVYTPVSFL